MLFSKNYILRHRKRLMADHFSRMVVIGLVLCSFLPGVFSQDYCQIPFVNQEFGSIQKVELKYGRDIAPPNLFGIDSLDLYLDLYYSADDTTEVRPVIILMHGGSFITELGNKSGMEEIARLFAAKGFVALSIQYRTWSIFGGGSPVEDNIIDVAVKAMLDLQSAIDFVVDENGKNDFPSVDVQNIIIGGGSAGAITINHRLYLNAKDSIPGFLSEAFDNNGGIYEESSDDYNIAYGVNLSGGIFDTAFISPGEPPLISIHGNKDSVVFYDRGLANGFIELYGSKSIDQRLKSQGIDSYLYTFDGGGHSNIYADTIIYRNKLLSVLDTGLNIVQDQLCLLSSLAGRNVIPAEVELKNTLVQQDLVIVNREPSPMIYDIIDINGRIIQTGTLSVGNQRKSMQLGRPGYYVFRAYSNSFKQKIGPARSYQKLFYHTGR